MMRGNEDNLYRFEEIEMLAEKVCHIFAKQNEQVDMRAVAANRHNPDTNSGCLIFIYESIIKG